MTIPERHETAQGHADTSTPASHRVASYDVFETLLVRDVGDPAAVFLLLGRRLHRRKLLGLDPAAFAHARHDAEQRARRRLPGRDTTLQRIHEELADATGAPPPSAALLASEELALEAELLHANPVAARLVADDRARGHRIVFVSDSYLPRDFIREVLDREGLWRDGDGLYVSGACEGRNKRTGELFTHMLIQEGLAGVSPIRVRHQGNHAIADVDRARAAGIGAHHLVEGNPTRYECRLEADRVATGGLSSVLAGAARRARLDIGVNDSDAAAIRDVTAGVAAPYLVVFTLWVLRRAERDGLRRLYFLAREGQVLYELAKRLAPAVGCELEFRYLHVSRQSVNVAAMDEVSEAELGWVLTNVETNTIRTVLQRLAIEVEAVPDELRALGLDPRSADRVPTETERRRLLDALVHGRLRPALDRGLAVRGRQVARYLEQEGFQDDISIGVVDTTGAGSQVWALERLRAAAGGTPIEAYLVYRKQPQGRLASLGDALRITGWFEDEPRGVGLGPPPGRAELLELFAAADHGTVLGYRETPGHVVPVLADIDLDAREAWGFPILRATLERFTDHLVLDPELVAPDADARGAVAGVLALLWETPQAHEAHAWGTFPFEASSGQEVTTHPLASPYTSRDLLQAMRRGAVRDGAWFVWRAGAEARSPRPVRTVLHALRLAKHAPRRLRHHAARLRVRLRSRA